MKKRKCSLRRDLKRTTFIIYNVGIVIELNGVFLRGRVGMVRNEIPRGCDGLLHVM